MRAVFTTLVMLMVAVAAERYATREQYKAAERDYYRMSMWRSLCATEYAAEQKEHEHTMEFLDRCSHEKDRLVARAADAAQQSRYHETMRRTLDAFKHSEPEQGANYMFFTEKLKRNVEEAYEEELKRNLEEAYDAPRVGWRSEVFDMPLPRRAAREGPWPMHHAEPYASSRVFNLSEWN